MAGFASLLAASAGLRVASLNLCTDELLLALAEPSQIVSVTHLSQQPLEYAGWKQARRYPKNDGSLLTVVGQRPDLILTMGGGVRDEAHIARRLGIRIVDLPYPHSVSDIETAITTVSRAVGQPANGARLNSRIETLKRSKPTIASDTIWLGGGGRSVAATGLTAEWMRLAGFRQRSLIGDRVTLEQLLVKPPAALLRSDYRAGQYSAEQRWMMHPLAKGTTKSRTIPTDGRAWTCMGPAMVAEVTRLKKVSGR